MVLLRTHLAKVIIISIVGVLGLIAIIGLCLLADYYYGKIKNSGGGQ